MNFLLIGIMSISTGYASFQSARSYQTSVMQRFDTEEQCEVAADALLKTYIDGNIQSSPPERGEITCTDLTTKVSKVVKKFE